MHTQLLRQLAPTFQMVFSHEGTDVRLMDGGETFWFVVVSSGITKRPVPITMKQRLLAILSLLLLASVSAFGECETTVNSIQ